MSDEAQDLNDIANFIILISTGAVIPLFLVIYKSRCTSICWGCIKRKVQGDDSDEEKEPVKPPDPVAPAPTPLNSPRPAEPEAEARIQV